MVLCCKTKGLAMNECATHRQLKWVSEHLQQLNVSRETLQSIRQNRILDIIFNSENPNNSPDYWNPFEIMDAVGVRGINYVPWGPRTNITVDYDKEPDLAGIPPITIDTVISKCSATDFRGVRNNTLRLIALNQPLVHSCHNLLFDLNIRPANIFELLEFIKTRPELKTKLYSTRVIALGSIITKAHCRFCDFPSVLYQDGKVKMLDVISGGESYSNKGIGRTFFLVEMPLHDTKGP